MNKTIKKLSMLMAAAAIGIVFAACSDDDKYSISKAEIDLDRTEVGQLSPSSSVTPFNLTTDKDAEWEATVEWDADENDQPAYVYPKKGVGPATLKIATLDNMTQQTRKANLVIRFPKDESKNITVPLTQQRVVVVNGEELRTGNITCGFGYGYNAFVGYCDDACIKAPILRVDEMRENDALAYNFGTYQIQRREESGASVEELARKLNATAHASGEYGGFSASVDAEFSGGQKRTSTNEFAWMDINVRSGRIQMHGAQEDLILEYMTDDAYYNINGMPKPVRGKLRVTYPSTPEGFRKMVMAYGTHLCVAAVLGGQIRTSVVANTAKISSAYNASVALQTSFNSSFANIDVNATAKAQQASAMSSNQSGFFFNARARGGSKIDGTLEALTDVLNKMSKARQGAGTEDDLTDDSDAKATISDNSEEFELAGQAWINSITAASGLSVDDILPNLVIVDFDSETDLVPLYELIDRELTEEEDGVDGEARYQAFKLWYETEMMKDPTILSQRPNLSSYITIPPTKVDPMPDMTKATDSESLIQDVYLTNGQHVARICSEFIPVINPSKRVSIIYPVVNGKTRYNLGIFCGDEASYPAQVSWGWEEAPDVPVVTTIKGSTMGYHKVAYLRGNHLSLDPDPKFSDSEYLTTTAKPYTFVNAGKTYPLVKINDYIYTRDLWDGGVFNNGTTLSSLEGKFMQMYRVSMYTTYQVAYGGFAPQGWSVPWNKQWRKLISNISEIDGNKPDGSIGASFLRGGVYGLNLQPHGFLWYENEVPHRFNSAVCYVGALADLDTNFWDGAFTPKTGSVTDRVASGVAITTSGTVSLINFENQPPVITTSDPQYYGGKKDPNDAIDAIKAIQNSGSTATLGSFVGYNLILSQKVVK